MEIRAQAQAAVPHGDPYKAWTVLSLTEEQLAFVKRALEREGGTCAEFARNAVLDKAADILDERAPGRPMRRARAGPADRVAALTQLFRDDPRALVREMTQMLAQLLEKTDAPKD